MLKDTIAANPDNTNRVVELAVLYENKSQLEESHKLLLPYRQKLGATEGARILGQYLLKEGHNDDAYGLLYPYVQGRLDNLRSVERDYTNAVGQAVQRAMGALNEGKADPDFIAVISKLRKPSSARW